MADIPVDILMVSVGTLAGGVFTYLTNRIKNKAIAERTVSEAWDKYSKNLEERIDVLVKQVEGHTDLISRQNQTIAEQNTTIAQQTSRIGTQDQTIASQSVRITAQDQTIKEQNVIIADLTEQVILLGGTPVHSKSNPR